MSNQIKNLIFASLVISALFVWGNFSQAAGDAHPAGSLVVTNGTVYKVSDNGSGLLAFDSAEKFLSGFYDFKNVLPMNSADQAKPTLGTAPWGDGRLFNENGTIYQVSNGQKHGFASAEIFLGYGFTFNHPINGQLNMPVGATISDLDQGHLPRTFVIDNGTVWLVTATGKKGLPSADVLFSWGRQFSDVVPAHPKDLARPDQGLLTHRTGAVINDGGTIWVIEQTNKRSFSTAECFTNFGYNFSMALAGSTANYDAAGSICGSGSASEYTSMTIKTSRGDFVASIMKFDLSQGNIKVVTDTANDADCSDNCSVQSLADYVNSAGGFAGINGTYFCPTDYPECAGKVNTFYWKVYNSRLNKMINASNGIKEEMPFIAFKDSEISYFSQYKSYMNNPFSITAGINHEPRLIENGVNVLNESQLDQTQLAVKSNRGAFGFKGQTVYAVIVRSANIPDLAAVMQSLGVDYAFNLDGGGSSAMIYDNSYKVGPGRNLPNAIIFVKQ